MHLPNWIEKFKEHKTEIKFIGFTGIRVGTYEVYLERIE